MCRKYGTLAGLVIGLLLCMGTSWGGIRPSFSLEESAWLATDIVVVVQGDKGVTVQETWKGSLQKGTILQVRELPQAPLEIASWDKNATGKTVGGGRVVLFIKHAAKTETQPAADDWVGVSPYGGTQVSVVWVEAGHAYAFQQLHNPGPTELRELPDDEEKFKQETMEILAAKDALHRAILLADPGARALALQPMITSNNWYQRHEAIAVLGECGPPALPVLRRPLLDGGGDSVLITGALIHAAGENAGAEMTLLLSQEVAFWRKEAPGLPVGWWNKLEPAERRERLLNHFMILNPALTALAGLQFEPARPVVREFRDLWTSMPQLNEPGGSEIPPLCDKILHVTERTAGPPAP